MDADGTSPDDQIDGEASPIASLEITDDLRELRTENESLVAELEALRMSYQSLQLESTATEENLILLQQQRDEALKHNADLATAFEKLLDERDALRDELQGLKSSSREREDDFARKIDEEVREKGAVQSKLEDSRKRIKDLVDEKTEKIRVIVENLEPLKSVKECLARLLESMDENSVGVVVHEEEATGDESELSEELRELSEEGKVILKLASLVELKLSSYEEMRKKEKRELENSVVSLTEENRDINNLLRIALVEKDAVEKTLNRLRGHGEQKKGAILQIAERGLQKVGFGFMMGSAMTEPLTDDDSGANNGGKLVGSECEEEGVSLVLLCFLFFPFHISK